MGKCTRKHFNFIPLSFDSPKERGKEKGLCDPKEISPMANRGCRQHECADRPFVSVTSISADRLSKPRTMQIEFLWVTLSFLEKCTQWLV
jgi:hypothetical protein